MAQRSPGFPLTFRPPLFLQKARQGFTALQPRAFEPARSAERQGRMAFTDASTRQLIPFCRADGRLLSSMGAPWGDVLKMEEYRVPPQETPESTTRDYHITMRLWRPGKVECRIAGERSGCKVVVPGDLHLVSRGVSRSARWYQETELLLMAVDPTFVAVVADASACIDRIEFTNRCAFQDAAITHLMFALRAELQAGCPAGRLYGESLAMALTMHLLRHYAVRLPKDVDPRGGLPPGQLRRVLDYMQAHLGDEISLRHLADLVRLSPHHFAALFKQSTGSAPYQYLLRQRIAHARHLLVENHLSLAEISYRLGFPSQAHFTTMFRKLVGTTPGAYRQGQ
jgi:AraC family transcriptional regulator